eukprot:PhM_4_TR17534/c0_g1_i1/m.15108
MFLDIMGRKYSILNHNPLSPRHRKDRNLFERSYDAALPVEGKEVFEEQKQTLLFKERATRYHTAKRKANIDRSLFRQKPPPPPVERVESALERQQREAAAATQRLGGGFEPVASRVQFLRHARQCEDAQKKRADHMTRVRALVRERGAHVDVVKALQFQDK